MTATLTIDDPAYFDRLAEVEMAHWWSSGMWRIAESWLDSAVRGRKGLRALDVGCGTGMTAVRLSRHAAIREVVGLDPSPEALARARRCHEHPLVNGSTLALPFLDEEFDVVTCFDVFQHLPEGCERRASAELCRVLRPEGIVLIRANGRGWGQVPGSDGPPYRIGELSAMVASAGLRVRRATYANCLPALAQELRGRLPWGTNSATAVASHPAGGGLHIRMPHPWINRLMGGIAAAEAVVVGRLGIALPFGHSTLVLATRGWRHADRD